LNASHNTAKKENSFSLLPGILCLIGAALFLAVSALLYWPTPEVAFRTDDSPAAWLSSAQLWAMALLALRLFQERTLPRGLCLWLCAAMMGMSFDEQFMFHEHWKYNCINWWDACRIGWITELPMLLVALFGMATALWLHRSLADRRARIQMWLAIGVGLFAMFLRFTQHPIDLLPYKAALLVLAEALFAGLFLGLKRPAE
jgi:hypothetical protein